MIVIRIEGAGLNHVNADYYLGEVRKLVKGIGGCAVSFVPSVSLFPESKELAPYLTIVYDGEGLASGKLRQIVESLEEGKMVLAGKCPAIIYQRADFTQVDADVAEFDERFYRE